MYVIIKRMLFNDGDRPRKMEDVCNEFSFNK